MKLYVELALSMTGDSIKEIEKEVAEMVAQIKDKYDIPVNISSISDITEFKKTSRYTTKQIAEFNNTVDEIMEILK